jgi:3-phosphoshikimate 1-carboxyvinyltransferase
MICKVEKSKLSGEVMCPPNKSYSHRAIFLASLAGNSRISNVLLSADTLATIDACRKFGAEIKNEDSTLIIKNAIEFNKIVPKIDAKNSGTTIRIASGIASLFSKEITLTGDSSLRKRPMQPLLDALESLGAKCKSTNGMPPVSIIGKTIGGEVCIPGNFSSQFVSSLLILAPLTEKGINLIIKENLVSKPYLDATIATMRSFGVKVQTLIPYKKYNISPQVYKPTNFTIPIDFSSLALLLSALVLNGEKVIIHGNIGNLPQGDEVFIDILEKLGVEVSITDEHITVTSPEKLNGGRFDLSNSPDLLPPLAILALKATNPIEIVNVKHARLKETDRISILSKELIKIGLQVEEREDGLILNPTNYLKGAVLNSEKDHRLFMAFCIAGMYIGNCTVTDPESIEISYPNFITDMNNLGAKLIIQ